MSEQDPITWEKSVVSLDMRRLPPSTRMAFYPGTGSIPPGIHFILTSEQAVHQFAAALGVEPTLTVEEMEDGQYRYIKAEVRKERLELTASYSQYVMPAALESASTGGAS